MVLNLTAHNSSLNAHKVRLAHLNHIQVPQGGFEKPTSFNPFTALFD
ncbi:MAG: hypothetical protein L0H74_11775 [Brachybacterium sp.]|nr:hypothetical protein [Brachybacterium sp.]